MYKSALQFILLFVLLFSTGFAAKYFGFSIDETPFIVFSVAGLSLLLCALVNHEMKGP